MNNKPMVKCGTCRFFKPYYPEMREAHENDDYRQEGTPGECMAINTDKLPYAWRYSTREVMQSWSLTEIYCAAHEPTPPTTDSTPKEGPTP
jgi:hypothetical protein